ncbi:hypothetical protein D3C86_2256970 [compost metagenome]
MTSNCRNASLPKAFLPVALPAADARLSALVLVLIDEFARMSLRLKPLVVSVTLI